MADDVGSGTKVYIFLNDAGAGKTTYFTWLAWRLSTYDRSLYVIKLIALEYSTDFERLEECGVDHWNDTQIVRLLYRFIHLALFVPSVCRRTIEETDVHRAEADRCAELISLSNGRIVLDETKTKDLTAMQLIELRLFREKFDQNQLVLILDGFDEIAPYYKDVVMKCFARFAQLDGLRNLYISSRPYGFVEAFKNAFSNCNICKLKPFTEEDQIYLLHLFLRSKIAAYSDCRFDELIPVVGILYATVNFQEGTIQNVPLMFYILYVTFLPKVQRYVDFDAQQICGKIFIEKGLPLLDMVETYVDLKLRIHNVEKAGLTDSASVTAGAKEIEQLLARDVKAEHGLLGAYVMFPKSCWNELFTKQQLKKVALYVHNLTQGEDSGGLIDRIQDGMPSFVHRSFAEFFAAYWLSQHYRRVLGSVSFFRSVTFWNDDSYQEIHTFFEAMVDRQCSDYPVHNVIKKRSTSSVEEIISQDPSAIYKRDGVGRTPFHLLARYYSNELVELLMKRNILVRETVSLKDELLQWSVLDYAFVCNNTTYIEQLLTLGPDVNLDVLLQQLLTSDIDLLLKRSHTLVNLLEKHDATRALTRQIHTRVVQHILRDRQLNLNARLEKLKSLTVLEYCTELGAYDMFLEFVAQSDDPYRVLATDINGLFQKAFLCRDTRFVFYYIEQHNFPLPWVDNFAGFSSVLVSVCGSYKMSTFKVLFKQLCLQRKIRCINESAILHEELPDAPGDEQFNRRIENMRCCVRSVRDIHNDLPIYQEGIPFQDECIVECLLARTIDMGSIEKTGYVLQMTETVVTNELIEKIMRLLPKGVSHKESIGTFKYLLQHATNLYQTDSEGRNLLHSIAQHGCFFMLHCLVQKGVDVSLVNAKNGWNVFHYIASRANNAHSLHFETDSRNIIFKYMLQAVPDPDYLTARDMAGYNVLDVAIVKQNFSVARTIVNSQISHVVGGAEERLQALFDKVKHVLTEEHEIKVTKFFWYLHEYTEEHDEWSEVYATAAKWKYSKPDYTFS
ncbi:AGAP012173-PA [Anopheles gambiae str. PEST]|uniref:AGAP012173-PA n=2 Tax=Anopheles gambiae TaxID=7165 RepID=A0NGK8_ANOGA|nr:AGAP012173-PA [Anopheles gambiae str. PEST]